MSEIRGGGVQAVAYCDASVKGDYCGVGVCLLDTNGRLLMKHRRRLPSCRNNNTLAEAMAVIEAVKLGKRAGFTNIRVYTDSKSVVRLSQKAEGGQVGGGGFAERFVRSLRVLRKYVRFTLRWVRGHAGKKWNCICDRMARDIRWNITDFLALVSERLGLSPIPRQCVSLRSANRQPPLCDNTQRGKIRFH